MALDANEIGKMVRDAVRGAIEESRLNPVPAVAPHLQPMEVSLRIGGGGAESLENFLITPPQCGCCGSFPFAHLLDDESKARLKEIATNNKETERDVVRRLLNKTFSDLVAGAIQNEK